MVNSDMQNIGYIGPKIKPHLPIYNVVTLTGRFTITIPAIDSYCPSKYITQ